MLGVAETWLGQSVPDDEVSVEGFNIVRHDRNVHGGGVALYVRKTCRVTVLATSRTNMPGKPELPEYLMCSVRDGDSDPLFVCVIYRPPKIGFTKKVKLNDGARANGDGMEGPDLVENLQGFCLDYRDKIVMGDLNADLLSGSDDSKFVRKLCDELSLRLIQHGPTHFTSTSQTWLDVIMVDVDGGVLDARNEEPPWPCKHRLIDVTIKLNVPQTVPDEDFYYRDYKSIDATELVTVLQACDWSTFLAHDTEGLVDIDGATQQLCTNLGDVIEQLAPLKRVKTSKRRQPWVGAELRDIRRKRDAFQRRHLRTGDPSHRSEYIRLRDLAITKEEEARSEYFNSKINKALQSNKNGIYRELRGLGLLPKDRVELNGFSPEELNKHFAGISISSAKDQDAPYAIIQDACEEGFKFKSIGWPDVILAIKHFTSQAVGEDGIPQSVIVKALPVICPFLVSIFNSSLSCGVFPALWKMSNVIPLRKCSAPSSCSDFRPISILCFLSKVLEKIAHDQLSEYFTRTGILDPLQTGFRAHHSTQTALLKLTDDIRLGMDRKLITFLVQFDFSKAFDTVSPVLLIKKLSEVGISRSALLWINSYLTDRRQAVVTGAHGKSSCMSTELGVPQGSVLGPLLFSIFINDIRTCLPDLRVKHLLYADDLQIYVQVGRDEVPMARELLETAAGAVSEWARGARLRLNTTKTRAAIFGNPRFTKMVLASDLGGLRLGDGTLVPFSDTVVSLGVVLDSRLSWKPHIDNLSRKFNRVLYSLRSFRRYTTESLRKRLAMALLFPLLDYCSVVLLDASLEQQGRLQVMQNACTRYVFGLKRSDSITSYRIKLGWLRIATRRDYFLAVLMYKVMRLRQPSYLHEFFEPVAVTRPVRGEARELNPTKVSTGLGRGSFQVRGAELWNSLPASVRTLPSLSRFKIAIKPHLQALD